MGLIADILLVAAALGATVYCVVLSRRLSRFTDLEDGVGGAIAALSVQVDDMTRTLRSAQGAAAESVGSLGALTGRAEDAARRLELLVAAMHDLPEAAQPQPAPDAPSRAAPGPPRVDASRALGAGRVREPWQGVASPVSSGFAGSRGRGGAPARGSEPLASDIRDSLRRS